MTPCFYVVQSSGVAEFVAQSRDETATSSFFRNMFSTLEVNVHCEVGIVIDCKSSEPDHGGMGEGLS